MSESGLIVASPHTVDFELSAENKAVAASSGHVAGDAPVEALDFSRAARAQKIRERRPPRRRVAGEAAMAVGLERHVEELQIGGTRTAPLTLPEILGLG